jgi:hypothetical protein
MMLVLWCNYIPARKYIWRGIIVWGGVMDFRKAAKSDSAIFKYWTA